MLHDTASLSKGLFVVSSSNLPMECRYLACWNGENNACTNVGKINWCPDANLS